MPKIRYPYWPEPEPEQSFDQKMKAGAKVNDGIAESMPMDTNKPYRYPHKTTRCDDDCKS